MRRAVVLLPLLLLMALQPALFAALSRPVVVLDGDPSVASPSSEDILLTQVVPGRVTTEFGSAVAFGDVNGDGYADAVVGQRKENKVFIYLGSAAVLNAAFASDPNAADIVISAPTGAPDRIQQFGFSVAVSKIDGDTYDDLIIGAPFSDPGGRTDQGLAWVVLAGGGLATGQSFSIADPNDWPAGLSVIKMTRGAAGKAGDLLGFAVGGGSLGSVADRYLVVTARDANATIPTARADAGAVHVVLGSVLGASGPVFDLSIDSAVTFFGADASDALGEAVTTCDVDGGGVADLFVGAIFGDGPGNVGINRGEALLFLGENIANGVHTGIVSATAADLSIHGHADGDDLGYSVACGDLDDDGLDDLVIGAIFADPRPDPNAPARPTAGEVHLFRGRGSQDDPNSPLRRELLDPDTLLPQGPIDLSVDTSDLTLFGATTADQLGFAVAVGDLDGDGTGDLIASARRYDRDRDHANVGATYMLLGSSSFLDPNGPGRQIDLHAGTARDVDLNYDPNDPVDHLPDQVDGVVIGASREDHSGWSLAAGDMDDDRTAELMISAIGDLSRVPGFRGQAYILFSADADGDGFSDAADRDDDNDGVPDADEIAGTYTGGLPTDPRDNDTDGDGLGDGLELGFTCAGGGGVVVVPCDDPNMPFTNYLTNPAPALIFRPDQDPLAQTDPLDADSDDDGLADGPGAGGEDPSADGKVDSGETDPGNHDTDGDLIFDGTERGLTSPLAATNLAAGHFRADADGGASLTNPRSTDSDGDLVSDGVEDANRNGAVAGDLDFDHQVDPAELWTEIDPADNDTDRDGLSDGIEDRDRDGTQDAGETNPLDQDTDDDGLPDGRIDGANGAPIGGANQAREGEDLDLDGVYGTADGESSPLAVDSDGDLLGDGLEAGVAPVTAMPPGGVPGRNGTPDAGPGGDGTDPTSANFRPDGDAGFTRTEPWDADTDDDGLPDGYLDGYNMNSGSAPGGIVDGIPSMYEGEDLNLNGVRDSGETHPVSSDTDMDGVEDGVELGVASPGLPGPDGVPDPAIGGVQDGTSGSALEFDTDETTLTNPVDSDTDDDGLSDGSEDKDGDGLVDAIESDPADPDTDNDFLKDGLEAGLVAGDIGTDLGAGNFSPDQDPLTMTRFVLPDTDGGGALDGDEDADRNGRIDPGERNPNFRGDDDRTGVLEFTDTLNGASRTTSITPGETIFLRIDDDFDQNTDPNMAELQVVMCTSSSPFDFENVVMTAIGPNSGVFAGSLPTNNTDPNIANELTLASGATITCTYQDPDDLVDLRTAMLTSSLTAPPTIPEFDIQMSVAGVIGWTTTGASGVLAPLMTYNLYRGDLAILMGTGVYTQTALCGLPGPSVDDLLIPARGQGVFYLVAGQMGALEGSIGTNSAGQPRQSTGPCAQ